MRECAVVVKGVFERYVFPIIRVVGIEGGPVLRREFVPFVIETLKRLQIKARDLIDAAPKETQFAIDNG